jgi:hypothetical protein
MLESWELQVSFVSQCECRSQNPYICNWSRYRFLFIYVTYSWWSFVSQTKKKCTRAQKMLIHWNLHSTIFFWNVRSFISINALPRSMCDIRRGFDCWMDVLTTYTHDSELQALTVPPLFSTIHKSPQHPLSLSPACCAISRSLVTASNGGHSWASRSEALSSQTSVYNWSGSPK